jgi:hypothetical protein
MRRKGAFEGPSRDEEKGVLGEKIVFPYEYLYTAKEGKY